jgi:membrane-bound lytic murein transglycosylase D
VRLLCVLAVAVGVVAGPVRAVPAEFEKPAALVPSVAFWKRVYAEWRVDDIALHDEQDLGLVYRVLRAPPHGGKDDRGRTRRQVVAAAVAETAAALRSLHKKKPTSPAGLSDVEREVFVALQDNRRTDKYAHADNVRAQNGMFERFVSGHQKSGLYEQFITEEMTRNGLPRELIGIAYVESLFHTGARSKVGAAGIWQFMSYTGREYMHLNAVVDERWDPLLATESAARYLRQAKKELGTWPLAVTSYNYGRGGMRELANKAGTNDFGVILTVSKAKRFGFAARNYYASFLAVLELLDEAPRRFGGVKKFGTWSYDVVRAPFPLLAPQVVDTGLVDRTTFDALNPALTPAALAGKVALPHGLSFRVPLGTATAVLEALTALPAAARARATQVAQTTHVANGRQKLAAIAQRHRLDVDDLAQRSGFAVDAVPPRGTKIPIPAPLARYTLLPEARGIPLAPLDAGPAPLVASLAPTTPGDAGADTTTASVPPPAVVPVRRRAVGKVLARVTRIESFSAELRGVDAVAGAAGGDVGSVDVVAGVAPRRRRATGAPLVSVIGARHAVSFSPDHLR